MRTAEIKRKTKETDIELRLTLEGGERRIDTGIGFFDHMLNSFAVHSGFGLTLTCKGDLEVDGHHSVEDCGIALGQALSLCLGDKAGIARFGQAFVPMDEALGFCALDISGRPYLVFDAPLREIQPDGSRHPFDQFIVAKTPAGRWGDPEDMVGPCVFLASHASDFVNGQILYADGGILAYIGRQPK